MPLSKLTTTNGFVVRDLDHETPALGIVRSAPKILQSGAKDLARSQTYQFAVLNMRCQGASAGINAAPEDRARAVAAFVEEISSEAASGSLMIEAGKGVDPGLLDSLFDADPRNAALVRDVDGVGNRGHLLGLGAVACANAHTPLEGRTAAIDNFESVGSPVARQVVARGGKVVAIATRSGYATRAEGFDIAELDGLMSTHGPELVEHLGADSQPSAAFTAASADVLFTGSKMGVIDHRNANAVNASLVVPTAPLPYTTKGALIVESNGTTVLPDFVTTAGPIFAALPPGSEDQESIESDATGALTTLVDQIAGSDRFAILEACNRAESFLASWRSELPFGRPFAA